MTNNRMTDEEITQVNEDLHKIEGELEAVGKRVFSVVGSGKTWGNINLAVSCVDEAINALYYIRAAREYNERQN